MSNKSLAKRLQGWLSKGSNVLALAAIILSSVSLYNQISPIILTRARLTLFVEYVGISNGNDNATVVTVYVKVVNDSPKTATIRKWDLLLDYNVTSNIVNEAFSHMALTLAPSAQTDINMTKTVIGANNSVLPQKALRNVVVTISYEDYIGLQQASREYGFL